MNCKECLAVMEEYVDGELEQRVAVSVTTHVAACTECAQKFEELKDEQQVYALYQRELEVTPALWNGVRSRLAEERHAKAEEPRSRSWRDWFAGALHAPRLSPALAVALVVLAVGITVGVMKYVNSHNGPTPSEIASQKGTRDGANTSKSPAPAEIKEAGDKESGTKASDENIARGVDDRADKNIVVPVAGTRDVKRPGQRPEALVREPSPDQLVREAEQKYVAAITILSRDVRRRRSQLDPEIIARFDQTLAAVDSTIAETRRAVRARPDDPVAVQYMLTAYAKKVEVLKEIASY